MTYLAMTKIIVRDLETCAAFYRAVCGFDATQRITGDGFVELILTRTDRAGAALVLLADGTAPPPGEAILVFETDDITAFTARISANGGTLTRGLTAVKTLGLTFAMCADPEGHALEAIERR